jgi:hypothetical protein
LHKSKKRAIIGIINCKFVSLKRILPILSIILLTAIHSQGQSRTLPQDAADRVVKFYPNPATSFVTFDLQKRNEKGYDIQVFNFLGQVVYEQKNIPSRTIINLSDYNRGVYIYQLREREGKIIESGKFQVSK